jgi:hypothetical protein
LLSISSTTDSIILSSDCYTYTLLFTAAFVAATNGIAICLIILILILAKGGELKVFGRRALSGSLKPQNCLLKLLPDQSNKSFSIFLYGIPH